jgi:hypothetical protein
VFVVLALYLKVRIQAKKYTMDGVFVWNVIILP